MDSFLILTNLKVEVVQVGSEQVVETLELAKELSKVEKGATLGLVERQVFDNTTMVIARKGTIVVACRRCCCCDTVATVAKERRQAVAVAVVQYELDEKSVTWMRLEALQKIVGVLVKRQPQYRLVRVKLKKRKKVNYGAC